MITLPAHTARISTMADGSWRIVFDLGELSPEQVGELSKVNNKVVRLGGLLMKGLAIRKRKYWERLRSKKT